MSEPSWLVAARKQLGLKEKPGANNNPVIVGYFARLGLGPLPDATAWCAAFVGNMLLDGGVPLEALPKKDLRAWARAYLAVGKAIKEPKVGAIAVYQRGNSVSTGHVGFWVGETGSYDLILGGNQSDAVTIARKAKKDRLGFRWPDNTVTTPVTPEPAPDETLRQLQAALNKAGHSVGPADGEWGPMTRKGLNAWQTTRGLPLDAAAPSKQKMRSYLALLSAPPKPEPPPVILPPKPVQPLPDDPGMVMPPEPVQPASGAGKWVAAGLALVLAGLGLAHFAFDWF